jgi:hypothetical protein
MIAISFTLNPFLKDDGSHAIVVMGFFEGFVFQSLCRRVFQKSFKKHFVKRSNLLSLPSQN